MGELFEDLICGFGPDEGPGVPVVIGDVTLDGVFQCYSISAILVSILAEPDGVLRFASGFGVRELAMQSGWCADLSRPSESPQIIKSISANTRSYREQPNHFRVAR